MRATVIAAFRDRQSWRAYDMGVEYEGDESRVSELAAQGLVSADGIPEGGGLATLSVGELKALCDERGIAYAKRATKAQLLGLLSD